MKKIIILIACALCLTFALGACGEDKEPEAERGTDVTAGALLQEQKPVAGEKIAVMTTNYGTIKIKFFPEQAPKAVENFMTHAEEGYYDGLIFHRVINDFMIQGGDPSGTGYYGESIWGKPFEDEFSNELFNFRGALSMANSGPNTNGSQFFIVQAPEISASTREALAVNYGITETVLDLYDHMGGGTPWLDGAHTVFGQVFEGMDVVDEIAAVSVNTSAKPLNDVVIEKIEIVEYEG